MRFNFVEWIRGYSSLGEGTGDAGGVGGVFLVCIECVGRLERLLRFVV